jgi:hypothetical protein
VSGQRVVLLDLDQETRSGQLARAERWLGTTRVLQSAYRGLLHGTVESVAEPHVRSALAELLDVARGHEDQIDDLYRALGREPQGAGALRTVGAGVLSRAREALGHLEGVAAGAAGGSWHDLRELLLSNLDAMSGFAVTEQLGLALGVPAVVDITLPITRRKTQDQLLLQEYFLETAAQAVLVDRDL